MKSLFTVIIVIMAILYCVGIVWADIDASRMAELEREIVECEDPLKIRPGIFKEIKTIRGIRPRPNFKKIRKIQNEGLVYVFVDSVIYTAIQVNLDQFISDLEAEDYSVSITQVTTQTPEDIRAILQSEYPSDLVGVIMVGDVPAAWMETSYYYTSHFPTDYFYMDLDGTWADIDLDGFYDHVSGDTYPEIWAGRLTPSNCIFGDEVELLIKYFAKNHVYRTGNLNLPQRALAYLDCPWYNDIGTYLGWVYNDVTVVDDEDTTTALHYKRMSQEGYEWIHLLAHSSPWGHTFLLHNEEYGGGSLFDYEIPPLNPEAIFVLLNACSNCKYTESNNLGQSYLFGSDYICAIIGETKIMYGDEFEDLYASLASGKNLGESFLDWIWSIQEWFWGCHIFGDPTLKPHGQGNPLNLARSWFESTEKKDFAWITTPVDLSPFTDGNSSACVDHSGNIWVAWNAGRDVRANIWTSHYDGFFWSEPEEVAFSVPWDFHPSMATDNSGNVWIIWQSYRQVDNYIDGYDIYGIYNNGSSWSSPLRITTADPYDVEPKVAVDSAGNVWAVWRTERKPDSDIMYSFYNGSVWSPNTYLVSSPEEDRDPVIMVDKAGKVWVVWYSKRDRNWDLFARYFNGIEWSTEIRLTTDPGYDLQPTITADTSGLVWVIWRSNRNGNLDIYSKYYNGIDWSPPIQVTSDPADDLCPSAASMGDRILVTWQSNRDGEWRIYESLYDTGWSPATQVNVDEGNQIQPVVFPNHGDSLNLVFQSDPEENWDIYWSRGSIGTFVSENPNLKSPKTFALFQNYPNPFNVTTVIGYQLPAVGNQPTAVSLRVYNLLGQEVATLVDGIQLPGYKSIRWNASSFASGIYFYRLQAGDFVETRKLILLK